MMRLQTNRIRTFSAFGTILKGLLVLALFFSVPASVFAEEIPEGNPNETTEEAAVKEPDSLTEEENDPEPETDLREETADEDTAAENTAEPVPEEEIPEESSGEETGKKAEDGEEESGASALEESTSSETSFPMDSGLPSSYNSADFGYVTPIRNQNPFGTCISFGFIAAAESSVLKHNLLPGETAQTLDFSERHLFWFASHAVPDPLGNTVGDDVVYVSDPKWDDPGTYINCGLKQLDVVKALAVGFGPVREEEAPYSTLVESYNRHSNTDKDFKAFLEETALENTWKNAAEKNVVHLQGIHTSDKTDAVNSRKRLIMEYGAVEQEILMDSFYLSKDFALFTDDHAYSPHSVAIVGWDDTYSREHFGNPKSGNIKPKQDGAFLVKNSYGSDWGIQGYFWLSYEDPHLSICPSVALEFGLVSDWTNIYMHDGGIRGYSRFLVGGDKAAAVYSVPNDAKPQRLSRISTTHLIREKPTPALLQIYRNPKDPKNPESGEALLKEKQKMNPNAEYTLFEKLAEEVVLYPGDRFSIVLEIPASEDSGTFMFFQDMDDEDIISGVKNIAHTEPGESFTYTKNEQGSFEWQDMALLNKYSRGVLRLRAYTTDLADIRDAAFDMASHVPYTGSAVTPPVKVVYDGKELTEGVDYTLEYHNNIEPGKASVIVRGIGNYAMEQELFFEIALLTIEGVKEMYSYTGEEICPEVTVTFGENTLVKDRDYTVNYRNNRRPGYAEVIVTGRDGYAFEEVLTFRIVRAPEPEKEEDSGSSPVPLLPQAYTAIKHASPNTSDPFESAKHWTVFVTSSLTALGSLLVLRQRR